MIPLALFILFISLSNTIVLDKVNTIYLRNANVAAARKRLSHVR